MSPRTCRVAVLIGLLLASAPTMRAEGSVRPQPTAPEAERGSAVAGAGAGGRLRVRVLDALGRPVARARVRIVSREPGTALAPRSLRTDASGAGAFSALPFSHHLLVTATAPGRARVESPLEIAPIRPETTRELRLWDGTRLEGRVVDREGRPVADAEVLAVASDLRRHAELTASRALSDDEGRFGLEGVALGRIAVRVAAPGRRLAELVLVVGPSPEALEIVVGEDPGRRLEVRLEGAELVDLDRVHFSLLAYRDRRRLHLPRRSSSGQPDAHGRWEVDGLPEAALRVVAHVPDHLVSPRLHRIGEEAEDGQAIFVVKPAPERTIRGRLLDEHGRPRAGEGLLVLGPDGETARPRTGPDGDFAATLRGPFRRRYLVRCVDPSWRIATSEPGRSHVLGTRVRFPKDGHATLALSRAGSVRGVVADADGAPVPHARVRLERSPTTTRRARPLLATLADERGHFAFSGLPTFREALQVRVRDPSGDAVARVSPQPAPGRFEPLRIRLRPPTLLRGRILAAPDQAVGGAVVRLRPVNLGGRRRSQGPVLEVFATAEGRFAFLDAAPGHCALEVFLPPAHPNRSMPTPTAPTGPLPLEAGSTETVELRVGS